MRRSSSSWGVTALIFLLVGIHSTTPTVTAATTFSRSMTTSATRHGLVAPSLTRPKAYPRNNRKNDQDDTDNLLEFQLNLLLKVRGGSIKSLSAEDDEDDAETAGIVVRKVRNIVRSLLKATKGSPLHGILSGVFGTIQAFTGISLLPVEKKKTSKTKTNKKSTKSKSKTTTTSSSSPKSSRSSTKASKKTSTSNKSSSDWDKKEIKSTSPNYRIQRELKAFLADPPPNLSVKVGKNLRVWIVTMKGAANTIYEGETFKLRIAFPPQYPQVPPSVYFLPPHIPVHEHVYTNGDICLSLLGKDWRPTMTAQSIAVSILSILSSAQSKSLPMDNARHAQNRPGQYQKDWVYHDDK